jgi:hypothetical protein
MKTFPSVVRILFFFLQIRKGINKRRALSTAATTTTTTTKENKESKGQ